MNYFNMGRATSQVESSRIPITMARIRFPINSSMVFGQLSDTGTAFILVLQFPLPIIIPSTAPLLLIILSSALYIIISILIASLNNKLKKKSNLNVQGSRLVDNTACALRMEYFSVTCQELLLILEFSLMPVNL
jgi:hypothetical protein